MEMWPEKLDEDLKQAIRDRLEGYELVEFLQIDIEDVILAFEEEILDKLPDIKELLGMEQEDE
jgi:hypothetical protein